MPVAVITGASKGLGRALSLSLASRGWVLVIDARNTFDLKRVAEQAREAGAADVVPVTGNVAEPEHRLELRDVATELGPLDLLVNNASMLGPSPMPRLADYPLDQLEQVLAVNVLAPLALTQLLAPSLRAVPGRIVNVTSDAAVEPYAGWGGYGASKSALEQMSAILGAEEPAIRVYVFDPGDMRTDMHQAAFPGEDISDRPLPETVVPALLRLVDDDLPSGRYRSAVLGEVQVA
ncbi:MAG: SDR family NAD(P)-dependent oxidoreductase [Nocardioidaceae bacterium]